MTMYKIPEPSPNEPSQYFVLFYADPTEQLGIIPKVSLDVPKLLKTTMANSPYFVAGRLEEYSGDAHVGILEGGQAGKRYLGKGMLGQIGEIPEAQLVTDVTGHFENKTLEHPIQGGENQISSFSLDHMYSTLNSFSVEANLYQGRKERFELLQKLREGHIRLDIFCDFGTFKNYILTQIEPVLSMESANIFNVRLTFQEIRKVALENPIIEVVENVSKDTIKQGGCLLERTEQEVPEDKPWWQDAIGYFTFAVRNAVVLGLFSPFDYFSVQIQKRLIEKVITKVRAWL